jgi:hypothetical protein
MAQEQQKRDRQIKHLETLQSGIEKLHAKRARLQAIYLDPDIDMTKEEYLGEKKLLDDQISYFVFKENIGCQAILGTILAIAGVAILFLA